MNILTKITEIIQKEQEEERKEQTFRNVLLELQKKYLQAEALDQKKEIVDELLAIRRVRDVFKCYIQDWRDTSNLHGRRYDKLSPEKQAGVALEFTNGVLMGRICYRGMPRL